MNTGVNTQLSLRKNSKSSRFASWSGDANSFMDKLMRAIYIFMLFAIDMVMFVYSINGRLVEDGQFNPAVLYLFGGIFLCAFVLMLLLSFSKDVQNVVCALVTVFVTVLFFYQFALFDVDTFIENWLAKKASWLTFIGIIPAVWLVALSLGAVIFFIFRYSFGLMFVTLVLLAAGIIGVKKNEFIPQPKGEYSEVKSLGGAGSNKEGNLIYFMLPKMPSYQFLSSIRDHNIRELRDLMVGFYALNNFEIYPNAFIKNVKSDDTMSNMVDIFNQVDYTSTTSGNRAYSEYVNSWNFIHGGLDYFNLEDNRLYTYLKSQGYGISTYTMPGFNTCITGGNLNTDRCVIKSYKTVSLYDKTKSVEQNIYALLAEWILSLNIRDLKSTAKMFADMSPIKGFKVTAENRRVSQEGAPLVIDKVAADFVKDTGGQAYIVYVDMPSDIYIYDEFCNLKPRKEWIALKDNSLSGGGIDDKRKAYAEQAKCLIGKMQEFMDIVTASHKGENSDIIIQGVSNIRELAGMTGGRYGNFVKEQLVNLAIRKGKRQKFLINANICLASDFTKTLIRYQDYCYSIDNMNLKTEEALSLKQNLINNSVIRGSKISNIAANYVDWLEEYKQKSRAYQEKQKKAQEQLKKKEQQNISKEQKYEQNNSSQRNRENRQDNIFVPTDDLILEMGDDGEIRSISQNDTAKDVPAAKEHMSAQQQQLPVAADGAQDEGKHPQIQSLAAESLRSEESSAQSSESTAENMQNVPEVLALPLGENVSQPAPAAVPESAEGGDAFMDSSSEQRNGTSEAKKVNVAE